MKFALSLAVIGVAFAATTSAAPHSRHSGALIGVADLRAPGVGAHLKASVGQKKRACLRRRDESRKRVGGSLSARDAAATEPSRVAPRELVSALSSMSISDLQQLQQLATDAEAQQLQNPTPVANATTNQAVDLGDLGSLLSGLLGGSSSPLGGVANTVAGVTKQVNDVLLPLVGGLVSTALSTVAATAGSVPVVGPTVAGLAGGLDVTGTLGTIGQLEGSLISGLLGAQSNLAKSSLKAAVSTGNSTAETNTPLPAESSTAGSANAPTDDAF